MTYLLLKYEVFLMLLNTCKIKIKNWIFILYSRKFLNRDVYFKNNLFLTTRGQKNKQRVTADMKAARILCFADSLNFSWTKFGFDICTVLLNAQPIRKWPYVT